MPTPKNPKDWPTATKPVSPRPEAKLKWDSHMGDWVPNIPNLKRAKSKNSSSRTA